MEQLAWVEAAFGVVILVALIRMERQARKLTEQSRKLREALGAR